MLLIIISPFWSAFYSHQKGLSFRLTKCINWQQAEFVVAHCVNNPKYESKGKVGLHLTTTQSLRQTSSNHHNRTLSASVLLVQPILTWLVGLIIGCGESNVMSTYFAMHVPHSEDVSQSAPVPYNTWMSFGTSAAWGYAWGSGYQYQWRPHHNFKTFNQHQKKRSFHKPWKFCYGAQHWRMEEV